MTRTIKHVIVILCCFAALGVIWQLMQPHERDVLRQQPEVVWQGLQQSWADTGPTPQVLYTAPNHEKEKKDEADSPNP